DGFSYHASSVPRSSTSMMSGFPSRFRSATTSWYPIFRPLTMVVARNSGRSAAPSAAAIAISAPQVETIPVMRNLAYLLTLPALAAAAIPADLSGVKPGPITVDSSAASLSVHWRDEAARSWTAEFSLDPKAPLVTAISVDGAPVIARARPFFQCTTGKRRGG